jgi:hypothetical protein
MPAALQTIEIQRLTVFSIAGWENRVKTALPRRCRLAFQAQMGPDSVNRNAGLPHSQNL